MYRLLITVRGSASISSGLRWIRIGIRITAIVLGTTIVGAGYPFGTAKARTIAVETGELIGIGAIESATATIDVIVRNATGTVIVPIETVSGTATRPKGTAMAAAMAIDLKMNGMVTAIVPIARGTGSVAVKIVQESEISRAAARKATVNLAIGRPAGIAAVIPARKAMAAVRAARTARLEAVRRISRRPVPVAPILQLRVRAVLHQAGPAAVRTQAVRGQRGEARRARPNPR